MAIEEHDGWAAGTPALEVNLVPVGLDDLAG